MSNGNEHAGLYGQLMIIDETTTWMTVEEQAELRTAIMEYWGIGA